MFILAPSPTMRFRHVADADDPHLAPDGLAATKNHLHHHLRLTTTKTTTTTMGNPVQDAVEDTRQFVKDGTQFMNRCKKPNEQGTSSELNFCRPLCLGC